MSRRNRSWSARPLGPLQAAIMATLWSQGPLSAADVLASVAPRGNLAYTTIHTELTRLLERGLVIKRGRHTDTKYAAAVDKDEFMRETVRQTLVDLVDTHGAAAVHGFVEVVSQNDLALAELRRVIRRRR